MGGIEMGFIGDGAMMLTGFLRFGVPCRLGAKNSVTGRPPSGLMAWDVAFVQEDMSLVNIFLAACTASTSSIIVI